MDNHKTRTQLAAVKGIETRRRNAAAAADAAARRYLDEISRRHAESVEADPKSGLDAEEMRR